MSRQKSFQRYWFRSLWLGSYMCCHDFIVYTPRTKVTHRWHIYAERWALISNWSVEQSCFDRVSLDVLLYCCLIQNVRKIFVWKPRVFSWCHKEYFLSLVWIMWKGENSDYSSNGSASFGGSSSYFSEFSMSTFQSFSLMRSDVCRPCITANSKGPWMYTDDWVRWIHILDFCNFFCCIWFCFWCRSYELEVRGLQQGDPNSLQRFCFILEVVQSACPMNVPAKDVSTTGVSLFFETMTFLGFMGSWWNQLNL